MGTNALPESQFEEANNGTKGRRKEMSGSILMEWLNLKKVNTHGDSYDGGSDSAHDWI
jgi:hypothetical protein